MKRLSGRCLCGAVTITAQPDTGDLNDGGLGACHCDMCRRWTSSAFVEFSAKVGSVSIKGPAKVFQSSEWAERCSCKTCGTALYYKLVDQDYYVASAEAFDDLSGFEFTQEIFIDEKPAYYSFANETAKMTGAEVFAAFAASQGEGNG